MTSTRTASWLSRSSISAVALTLPVAIWACDSLYSVYTVKGKSMEPSLMEGDVVLVRKVDLLPIVLPFSTIHSDEELSTRARLLRADGNGEQALLLSRPPIVLPGDVVVFDNPARAFPKEPNIKRVVALGGQVMRPRDRFQSLETIPKFNMWLEGDNVKKTEDSNTFGPVSKKLLVGRAERVLWPPSRWRRIQRVPPSEGRAWWM